MIKSELEIGVCLNGLPKQLRRSFYWVQFWDSNTSKEKQQEKKNYTWDFAPVEATDVAAEKKRGITVKCSWYAFNPNEPNLELKRYAMSSQPINSFNVDIKFYIATLLNIRFNRASFNTISIEKDELDLIRERFLSIFKNNTNNVEI